MDSIDPSIPPFRYTLAASPDAEIWDHTDDSKKLQKFGWRTTTNENNYETKTRIGNWNENNFGLDEIQKQHHAKSQYGHYFESTQSAMSSRTVTRPYGDDIKYLLRKEATAFPGHQPELCSDYTKELLGDMYESNYSLNFKYNEPQESRSSQQGSSSQLQETSSSGSQDQDKGSCSQ